MANEQTRSIATMLLVLNFCMYAIVLGIGAWAMNEALNKGFTIGPGSELPPHFSPIYFPMGNAATGFFVTFAMIAGVSGVASVIAGLNYARTSSSGSTPAAGTVAGIAWSLTALAMGFACKEIDIGGRNARLRTMEAFTIILTATQLLYMAVIYAK